MTRPNLAWSYSEVSKYVQFLGIAHMEAGEHVQRYLRDTWNESLGMSPSLTPVALGNQMSCWDGWTPIELATLMLAAHTPATSS